MPQAPKSHGARLRAMRPRPREDRESACKRGYDRKWAKARRMYLSASPLCVECEVNGRLVPATVVDHIVPHRGDRGLFWDVTNWQALCAMHHSQKTGRGE